MSYCQNSIGITRSVLVVETLGLGLLAISAGRPYWHGFGVWDVGQVNCTRKKQNWLFGHGMLDFIMNELLTTDFILPTFLRLVLTQYRSVRRPQARWRRSWKTLRPRQGTRWYWTLRPRYRLDREGVRLHTLCRTETGSRLGASTKQVHQIIYSTRINTLKSDILKCNFAKDFLYFILNCTGICS